MKTLRALVLAALVPMLLAGTAAASSTEVTQKQYDKVQVGWSRYHTQHLFGLTGERVVVYYDGRGRRHLIKDYPGPAGATIEITYVGPPRKDSGAGPYHVKTKTETG